jgi:hypothetical protein
MSWWAWLLVIIAIFAAASFGFLIGCVIANPK